MTINQFETFLLVGQCLNFTEAAQRLYITPSAVSRQINAMEEELRTKLFIRKNNTVDLTAAGRAFKQGLNRIYPDYLNLTEQVWKIGQGIEGELRLGLLKDQCLDKNVKQALRDIAKAQNVRISVSRMDFRSLHSSLLDGSLDVINTIHQVSRPAPGLEMKIYATESSCLAVGKEIFSNPQKHISQEQILKINEQIPILMPYLDSFEQSIQMDLNQVIESFGNSIKFTMTDDFESIQHMVAMGLAATVVNQSHILCHEPGVQMCIIDFHPKINKGLFWLGSNSNPLLVLFLQSDNFRPLLKVDKHF